jgi:hypothetical protein
MNNKALTACTLLVLACSTLFNALSINRSRRQESELKERISTLDVGLSELRKELGWFQNRTEDHLKADIFPPSTPVTFPEPSSPEVCE